MPYVRAIFPQESGQGQTYPYLPTSLGLLSLPALPMAGRSSGQSEGTLDNRSRKLRSSPPAGALQDIRPSPTREVGRPSRVDDRIRGIYRPVRGRKTGPSVGQSWYMDRLVGPPAEDFRTLRLGGVLGACEFVFFRSPLPHRPSAIFSPSYCRVIGSGLWTVQKHIPYHLT